MRNTQNSLAVGLGMALCVLTLWFAGCPNSDSNGEEVYRIRAGALSLGEIEAWPDEGPAGTEITLGIYPNEGCAFVPGTLYYRVLPEGERVLVPSEGSSIVFVLPASDVEVGVEFRDIAALIRRMVPVPGKTVGKKTGRSGAPFFNAGAAPVEVKSFKIGAAMVSYQLWYEVRVWAEDPARGGRQYNFWHTGREGTADASGSLPPSKGHRYDPVVDVLWKDVVVWCNAYSEWAHEVKGENTQPVYKKDGQVLRTSSSATPVPDQPAFDAPGYRLPTEAEWEFAARGGDPAAKAWTYRYPGSDDMDEVAWHRGNAEGSTHYVGLKDPNTLGLYDMGGNADEWCWDIHSGTYRVGRGIALDDRYGNPGYMSTGFRVVCPPN